MQSIENALVKSKSVETLIMSLDKIFIDRIGNSHVEKTIKMIKNKILVQNGNVSISELSSLFHYSEKHIQRLFTQYIGTSPKVFSRIVRVNYALRLLQLQSMHFADIAMQTGFFDQPHFIHDFKSICNLTPQEYMRNMSDFYNDKFKF